jgi:uncharacterized protein
MAKPAGPACNLNCSYCFYLEKSSFFPGREVYRMSDEVLEAYVRKTIDGSAKVEEITFAWQGGEPTLMKIDFFRRAFSLQKKYSRGKSVRNTLQTNGVLLNGQWCRFFRENDVLVGLSLDGPADIHNRYRMDRRGKGAFDDVIAGLENLKKFNVDVNVLCCVTRESPDQALEIYNFFKGIGVRYIQFIPVVERLPDRDAVNLGLKLAGPARGNSNDASGAGVTPWSVSPDGFGRFLVTVFDDWVRNDVGEVVVMNFDWALNSWLYGDSPACVYSKHCGNAVILEHNGDIYSCDHYMYPEYRLGNILTGGLSDLLLSEAQTEFGEAKERSLTAMCRNCDVLFACRGDCPKHRFELSEDGEAGQSYLCRSYKQYFRHIDRYMRPMCTLHRENLPVSYIMEALEGPLFIEKKPG